MSTKTAPPVKYKFNIRERLQDLTIPQRKKILDQVCTETGRSIPTINRIMYRPLRDNNQVDYVVLRAFAQAFKVSVEALENKQ